MKCFFRVFVCIMIISAVVAVSGCAEMDNNEANQAQMTNDMPELIIGSDEYEPYFYTDDAGNFVGIDVDIAREACRRIGYEPEFKIIEWDKKDEYLENGNVDCLWGSFTMTGREDDYNWVGPYMKSYQVVLVKANSDIYKLSDLSGKRIAVQISSIPEKIFQERKDSRIPDVAQLYSFPAMNEVYASISKGYVEAIAGHDAAIDAFCETSENSYRQLDDKLFISELGIAFSNGVQSDEADYLKKAIEEMKKDGKLKEIVEKNGLNPDEVLVD